MNKNKIIQGDSLEVLRSFLAESVDCVITSPPYWGLRDYGVSGQLGLEKTPEEYVAKMVEVFKEVKRVLKNEGTFWLNLGDSYSTPKEGNTETNKNPTRVTDTFKKELPSGMKPKNLVGIPWRVAFALQADGWYLRQDIIWAKPNPMPESVTDRCTKSHEYIFLFSKSPKYYFDNEAIKEEATSTDDTERDRDETRLNNTPGRTRMGGLTKNDYTKRNKRSVWTVTTKPFKEAHFATFPEDLIVPMVLAGCPKEVCKKCGKARERIIEKSEEYAKAVEAEVRRRGTTMRNTELETMGLSRGKSNRSISASYETKGWTDCGCSAGYEAGIVLDPFMGAGTTGLVAKKLQRNYLGIELNPEYIKIAEERINKINPML